MNADATAEYGWLLEAMNKGRLPALRDGGAVSSMIPQIVPASIPMPRMPEMPSARSAGGQDTTVNINVDVTGANGNQEIQDMVNQGVSKGIRRFSESPNFTTLVGGAVGKARSRNALGR